MNETERDQAVHGDHSRTETSPRICEATAGKHECDLTAQHVGHSRHMCVCGLFFDEGGESVV